jgi:hypothetical protein
MYKLNSDIKIVREDETDKVSKSEAKNLITDTVRREIPVKRERRSIM